MKQLRTFLSILAITLTACDKSVPLEINADKVYPIETACGTIEFRASTFSKWITVYQNVKSGEFELNLDSLSVSIYPKGEVSIDTVKFYDKDKIIVNSKRKVKYGDIVKIYVVFDKPLYTTNGTLLILPCNYIVCNKTPLISDTLRINF
jgi:hypothetical protein